MAGTEPLAAQHGDTSSRRLTSFDVARVAKVSQSTVSRALRGDPGIAVRTVRRVEAAARQLGYVPSERARQLSSGRTRRIAMLVDLDNPLWSLLVNRLYDELDAHGYRLQIIAGHGDQRGIEASLLGGGVDGVIVTTTLLTSSLPALLRRRSVPAVLLHRYTSDDELDSCVADNVAGGAAAAQVLLDAGHRRIAALFGPEETSTGRDRATGFRSRLEHAGIELPAELVRTGSFDMDFGRRSVAELLGGPRPPTAVFCANDEIAVGALNAVHDLGLSVPDDLAVMGFDDIDQASWPVLGLSTIRVPFADMLRSAVGLLFERVDGHSGGGRRMIHPITPVLRRTHGPAPSPADLPGSV